MNQLTNGQRKIKLGLEKGENMDEWNIDTGKINLFTD